MKKKYLKKVLLVIVLILVTITTIPKFVGAEDPPAIFRYGISQTPESIDCHDAYYDPLSLKGQVCEGLFAYDLTDPENAIVPRLADGDGVWSEDGLTLTVALKENVYFHDGTPFNADAVKWNFDRLLLLTDNPLFEPVLEEVIVIDNTHVSFKLFSPYVPFKSLLCSSFAYMMSPSSTPQYRFLDPEHHVLVGTGPYQYISYDGTSIEFEYWPYYYGGTPAIKQMIWQIYEDDYTKNQDLLEGNIHMVDIPDPSLFEEDPPPEHLLLQQGHPTSVMFYLGMNNIRIDTIFRQAISYAIDYETIITDIRDGQAIRLKSPIPNGILYANDGFGVATFDITEARTILIDNEKTDLTLDDEDSVWIGVAESEDPLLTINIPTIVGRWIDDLAHMVEENLKLIGIMVQLVEMQPGNYYGYIQSGEADIFISGWGPDFNDPSNFVNEFFSNISPNNWACVDDDYLEQLLADGLIEIDPSDRRDLYNQIQEYLVEDLMPFCYLYVNTYNTAWNTRLENYPINSLRIVWFFDCTWDGESTIPDYNQNQPIVDLKNIEPERNIEEAISSGLEWLAEEQAEDGGWNQDYTNNRVGISAFALLKLEERAFELDDIEGPLDPSYVYYENVMAGLNFIFENAYLMDTDSDTVDDALYFAYNPDEEYHHFVYETSVAMLAIAASEEPDQIVLDSNPSIDDWSYEKVLQFALNYLEFAQVGAGLKREGGWGYQPGEGDYEDWADNSNTGWAILALIYAQNKFGLEISEDVKNRHDKWIDFIQSEDGGSGYGEPNDWENVLKTGNLLFEMAFVGDDIESPRVQAAIHYIEEHWNDKNQDPGWLVNYQAMYTLMKGFESMGINTITVNGEEIDWFEDISFVIVESQGYDGSWPSDLYGDPTLTTAWALLTLEKVVEVPVIEVSIDVKPSSWPNPINLKSKGVLPVAICGTEDFDVTTIDPASIHIGGVPALFWSYEDVATPFEGEEGEGHALNGDTYTDLVLHFEMQEIIEVLGLTDFAGQTIPLKIEGNLKEEEGGTPIQGSDYVWIIGGEEWFILDPIFIDDEGGGDYTWKQAMTQLWCRGVGTLKNPYIIENVIIEGTGSNNCIRVFNSDAHFIIKNCILYGMDATVPGGAILLLNTQNGVIINNFCFDNGEPMMQLSSGIVILDSYNNIIAENDCSGNTGAGIYLASSNNNEILDNYCGGNTWGIIITGQSPYTIGDTSKENLVINNDCENNDVAGLVLTNFADYNILYGNVITDSANGIYFSNVDNNDIFGNTVGHNTYGIGIDSGCENNLIYHNNLIDNYYMQAFDTQYPMNNWYHPVILEGNYWFDYTGIDDDGDGIGDTPHFSYGALDIYPFMEENGWEYLTPEQEEILNVFMDPNPNRLGGGRTVRSDEISYLILGMGQLFSERMQRLWEPPYTIQVWFPGGEVFFQDSFWYLDTEGIIYPEIARWQIFYLIIPPYDLLTWGFTLGSNEFDWEISWYDDGELQTWSTTSYFELV